MDSWVWFPNLNYLEWFSSPPLAEKISLSAATESFIYDVVAYEACSISFFDDARIFYTMKLLQECFKNYSAF